MAKVHQEDPWAGFVDVLSNILMVVIFLIVLLGIAIFALSQQITKAAVEQAIKEERERSQTAPPPPAPAKPDPKPPATTQASTEDVVKPSPSADIDVAPDARHQKEAKAETIDAFLTLHFDRSSFKIDSESLQKIRSFLGAADHRDEKVEIQSYAGVGSGVGSISEGRRLAYYRAMQLRNELVKSGFQAANIDLNIRDTTVDSETQLVRLYQKK